MAPHFPERQTAFFLNKTGLEKHFDVEQAGDHQARLHPPLTKTEEIRRNLSTVPPLAWHHTAPVFPFPCDVT